MFYQVNYKDKTSLKVEVLDEIHLMNWLVRPRSDDRGKNWPGRGKTRFTCQSAFT